MANRWGIPHDVETAVIARDQSCVYCGVLFENKSTTSKKTWEHIINDTALNGADNIALCCRSCNASKGNKILKDWLQSPYCQRTNINKNTVASVVKKHLEK